MIRAGCYARKSNAEEGKDEDSKSVTRQIERAREHAASKGWAFDEALVSVDDNVSGAEFVKRPGLARMLASIKAEPFDVLIVSEQSRLGRDTIRTLALIQAIQDSGVKIVSYLDGGREITVEDEMGEVEGFMRSWASSQERRKASQRVRDAMRLKAERGDNTGGTTFGYSLGRKIISAEAEVVRRIFERRAEGIGMYRIARGLDKDGVLPPHFKPNTLVKRGKRKGEVIKPVWWTSTVADILDNESYVGRKRYGRTKRTKRAGTAHVEKGENVITTEVPGLRIVSDALWTKVQRVNEQARAACWRDDKGKLKSRAIASKWLLSPFLACGVCGDSMHAKQSSRGERFYYKGTRNAQNGKAACPNAAGMRVDHADLAVLRVCEEALSGKIVLDALDQVLEEHRRQALDPAPLKADAAALRLEVERLVSALARGAGVDGITAGIRDRKAKLEHVEGMLGGITSVDGLDLTKLLDRITPVLKNWRDHLRKNPAVAQQVLRKIIPERLKVSRDPRGGWKLDGRFEYTPVLADLGLDAVRKVVEQVKVRGDRSGGLSGPAIPSGAAPRGPHPAPPARSRHRRS